MARINTGSDWTVSDANLVPDGGTTGDHLIKTSDVNGAYDWEMPPPMPPDSMSGMWEWSGAPSTTVPGPGVACVNIDDPRNATLLTISTTDMDMYDRTSMFDGVDPDDTITFTTVGEPTSWHRFRVTANLTTITNGFQVAVETASGSISGTEPATGTNVIVVVDRVNAAGSGGITTVATTDSPTIDFSGNGTPASPLSAIVPADSITSVELAPNAVTGTELNGLSVASGKIVNKAVLYSKLQDTAGSPRTLGRLTTGVGSYEELTGLPTIICTSATRPTTPPAGTTIFETDTFKTLVYTTATTGWTPPWNTAWGTVVAPVQITANATAIGTEADVAGLTLTYTQLAHRRLKVTFHCKGMRSATANVLFGIYICNAANAHLNEDWNFAYGSAQPTAGRTFSHLVTDSAAGSTTYKMRAAITFGGATDGIIEAAATYPAQLVLEDIGPAANPT